MFPAASTARPDRDELPLTPTPVAPTSEENNKVLPVGSSSATNPPVTRPGCSALTPWKNSLLCPPQSIFPLDVGLNAPRGGRLFQKGGPTRAFSWGFSFGQKTKFF